MSACEQISEYISRLVAEKKIRPGEKLPTYEKLCRQFGISYTSCQRALKKIEQNGVVKIVKGSGIFLAGGESLQVDFYVTGTTFDPVRLQALLTELSVKHDLNLDILVRDKHWLDFHDISESPGKVVVTEDDTWIRREGVMLDYSSFPDYPEVISQFHAFGERLNNLKLPFYGTTFQGVLNTAVLRETGLPEPESVILGSDWWNELTAKCREHGYFPAVKESYNQNLWNFPCLIPAILMHPGNCRRAEELFDVPVFDTPQGERLFEIMRDFAPCADLYQTFYEGKTAVALQFGSWISTQFRQYPRLGENDFRVFPLKCGSRKIVPYTVCSLTTFLNEPLRRNESERIWTFLKLLVGKETQKKIAAMSGCLSLRRDMKPADHEWTAGRTDFREFFPAPDDMMINREILSNEEKVALGVLYEQFSTYGAPSSVIRKCMDNKLALRHQKKDRNIIKETREARK